MIGTLDRLEELLALVKFLDIGLGWPFGNARLAGKGLLGG
jgi:hypothetical protein